MSAKSAYVFVHGMFGWGDNEGINKKAPYWGSTCGSMMDFLRDNGYEVYAASVGPISSAWDQACELYAQLAGVRVDYGERHSALHAHRRYGRTYTKPLFEGWSKVKKVHLIGHSFGGVVIRLLVHLLTYGAPEEVEKSGRDNVSPLFLGGQEELVYSVTTLCTPLNGTSAYETARKLRLLPLIKNGAIIYAGLLGRSKFNGNLVDFHLEHTGLTDTPGKRDREAWFGAFRSVAKNNDTIDYDISPVGSAKINEYIKISKNVSYISYRFKAVREDKHDLPLDVRLPILFFTSVFMIADGKITGDRSKIQNDGLVEVGVADYPHTEPHIKYELGNEIKRGVWNVMPVMQGDHGAAIGLLANKENTRQFYLDMLKIISSTENQLITSDEQNHLL